MATLHNPPQEVPHNPQESHHLHHPRVQPDTPHYIPYVYSEWIIHIHLYLNERNATRETSRHLHHRQMDPIPIHL